ncbi:MAG TPA: VWA domain-containing protein [Candidatus Limnocylindrales bacterium]
MNRRPRSGLLAAVLAAVVLVSAALVGCSGAPSITLTVLAGSELKDLEPMLPAIAQATGVQLKFDYIGTLDGAQEIANGTNTADAAWFSHGAYLSLLPGAGSKIVAQEKIMLSPVILGVKQSVAQSFGWQNNPDVTWKDIQAHAADGSFHFAMTNPAASNSGFTALIGVASALSGSSDAIDTGNIDENALKGFFKGQTLTAGSSGFLADDYVRQQDSIDGIINYESILMGLNAGGQLHEPLTLIYPKEGIVTADYPFMLLNADKKDAWQKVVDYLRTPDVQRQIMTSTARRPVVPSVALDSRFPTQTLVELPFPSQLDTINALLTVYLDQIRTPASATFVLDLSGSMEGDRLNSLQQALTSLTGLDTSLTGQFARFRAREDIAFITFSADVIDNSNFTIDDTDPNSADMTQIRDYVDGLSTYSNTAIYTALTAAYQNVYNEQATDPNRLYSIVLMTDGENNTGYTFDQFKQWYAGLPPAVQNVHVYPILFGEGNTDEMNALATLTGGKTFDALNGDLTDVFKQIRGYQ